MRRLLAHTHSGGVTVNDWGRHVLNHDAPFGGVGNSGMGTYHGEEGFRELSHARTVFLRHRFFPIGLFYPPFGNAVQRLVLRLWLGAGEPGAANLSKRHPMNALEEFDYVISGAGSAGCALAARLSEDPGTSVCLLEAGGPDKSVLIHARRRWWRCCPPRSTTTGTTPCRSRA